MSEKKLPAGWDEDKLKRVLTHYEQQSEDEAVCEDEEGLRSSVTVMNVPHELVPKFRELIAKRHRS